MSHERTCRTSEATTSGTDVRSGAPLLRAQAQRFKPLVALLLLLVAATALPRQVLAQSAATATGAVVGQAGVIMNRAVNTAEHRIQPSQQEVDQIERLAVALFEEGEIHALAPRVRWLVAVRPNSWRALWLDAHISMLQGDMGRASASAGRCLEIATQHGPCHFVLGVALRVLGESPNGTDHLRQASEWGAADPVYSEPYARALMEDGEPELAMWVVEELLNSGRDGITIRLLAGAATESLGRHVEAEGHFSWVYHHHHSPRAGLRYLQDYYQRHGRDVEAQQLVESWERAQGPRGTTRVMRPL